MPSPSTYRASGGGGGALKPGGPNGAPRAAGGEERAVNNLPSASSHRASRRWKPPRPHWSVRVAWDGDVTLGGDWRCPLELRRTRPKSLEDGPGTLRQCVGRCRLTLREVQPPCAWELSEWEGRSGVGFKIGDCGVAPLRRARSPCHRVARCPRS
eukprot:scaffold4391_cov120-Isochrysis_galbana.AAC.2